LRSRRARSGSCSIRTTIASFEAHERRGRKLSTDAENKIYADDRGGDAVDHRIRRQARRHRDGYQKIIDKLSEWDALVRGSGRRFFGMATPGTGPQAEDVFGRDPAAFAAFNQARRRPATPPRFQAAQARAAEIENRINVTRARALAAQQGPNAAVDRIKLEIDFSQRLLIAKQNEIAAIQRLTLTDSGRAELAVKSGKLVADATIEQIKLQEQLADALEAQFLAQANLAGSFEGEAAVAERDIAIENERAAAFERSIAASKELLKLNDDLTSQGARDTAAEVAGFGMLAAVPPGGGNEAFIARGETLAALDKDMRTIARSSELLGMEFDSNAAKSPAWRRRCARSPRAASTWPTKKCRSSRGTWRCSSCKSRSSATSSARSSGPSTTSVQGIISRHHHAEGGVQKYGASRSRCPSCRAPSTAASSSCSERSSGSSTGSSRRA
jgi:hypothetical protein